MRIIRQNQPAAFTAFLALTAALSCTADNLRFAVTTDQDYNNVFSRHQGWTGGDGAFTIQLSDSVTLWLFGDSWIGQVKDNRHFNAELINNSVAVQYGRIASEDRFEFYFNQKENQPLTIIKPQENEGFYWLNYGGIKADSNLFLFTSHIIKKEADTSVFGFESRGNYIICIPDPFDSPTNWRYSSMRIPFFRNTEENQIDFGSPQFVKDGFIFIYGTEFDKKANDRYMLLARVPEKHINDFNRWEFYSNGKWGTDFLGAERLCNHYGAEFSVSYQPKLRRYITIYSESGMSENIMMRTAKKPEGPWSKQEIIYKTPETEWDKDYFCYAAKGHVELSVSDELLVSYVCNSFNFWKMASDARIYRPKFIRVKFL